MSSPEGCTSIICFPPAVNGAGLSNAIEPDSRTGTGVGKARLGAPALGTSFWCLPCPESKQPASPGHPTIRSMDGRLLCHRSLSVSPGKPEQAVLIPYGILRSLLFFTQHVPRLPGFWLPIRSPWPPQEASAFRSRPHSEQCGSSLHRRGKNA